jgi:hypothetical protein
VDVEGKERLQDLVREKRSYIRQVRRGILGLLAGLLVLRSQGLKARGKKKGEKSPFLGTLESLILFVTESSSGLCKLP